MLAIILAIIIIGAVGVYAGLSREAEKLYKEELGRSNSDFVIFSHENGMVSRGIVRLVGYALTIGILLCSTVSIIGTGECGVKTTFGVVSGSMPDGLSFKWPWEKVHTFSTKLQKYTLENVEASTKDLQIISKVKLDINYVISEKDMMKIFSEVGDNYRDIIFAPQATQLIKNTLSEYNAVDLVANRKEIADELTNILTPSLGAYGITVQAVSLTDFDFSDAYDAAIEAKAVAAQEIETAKNAQEKARIEAETNRIKSEQLTQAVLMDKLIDAIKHGNGTYVIDTNNLSIGVK